VHCRQLRLVAVVHQVQQEPVPWSSELSDTHQRVPQDHCPSNTVGQNHPNIFLRDIPQTHRQHEMLP
jgi:hypothetical protein